MSLKKIAELTGTSAATVSRVLNNPDYHCQDPSMTERILQTARSLNYIPNQNARQLKLGNYAQSANKAGSYVIDILLARFDAFDKDPFFREIFRHIETEFYKQNCRIGNILTLPDISRMDTANVRTSSDGLLILGKCPSDIVDILLRKYPSTIAIDRNPMNYRMDEVVCNGSGAAAIAIEYLLELGHRSIAYIGDCNMEARYIGYYECLLSHKIPLIYDYVIPTNQTREDGYRAFERIYTYEKRPTAIFCANDMTALGFLEAMKDANKHKKKQVYRPAVISIDDIEEASCFSPMLTTVRIPKEDMVHMAVVTLLDRLQHGHKEYIRLELPCHLIVRESSGLHLT